MGRRLRRPRRPRSRPRPPWRRSTRAGLGACGARKCWLCRARLGSVRNPLELGAGAAAPERVPARIAAAAPPPNRHSAAPRDGSRKRWPPVATAGSFRLHACRPSAMGARCRDGGRRSAIPRHEPQPAPATCAREWWPAHGTQASPRQSTACDGAGRRRASLDATAMRRQAPELSCGSCVAPASAARAAQFRHAGQRRAGVFGAWRAGGAPALSTASQAARTSALRRRRRSGAGWGPPRRRRCGQGAPPGAGGRAPGRCAARSRSGGWRGARTPPAAGGRRRPAASGCAGPGR